MLLSIGEYGVFTSKDIISTGSLCSIASTPELSALFVSFLL